MLHLFNAPTAAHHTPSTGARTNFQRTNRGAAPEREREREALAAATIQRRALDR
jgi:hypothetical protein